MFSVDGVWGEWGPYGVCSVTCGGGGTRTRSKTCTTPQNGGNPCVGNPPEETEECNNQLCPGKLYTSTFFQIPKIL